MRLSYACYGNSKTFAQLNCHRGSRISVQKIVFGSKKDPACPSEATVSTPLDCCVPKCGECLAEDSVRQAAILEQSLCDGKTDCSARAQRTTIAGCGNKPYSNYMVVMYDCIPDSQPLFASNRRSNATVTELLCTPPPFRSVNLQRPIEKPATRLSQTVSMTPQNNVTNLNNRLDTRTPEDNSNTRDLSREAAIIGGVTAGIVLIMVAAIVLAACICSRQTDPPEEEDEKQETKSTGNLSFIDPITMQPSYHAFGSVDGSSMTNYCGHIDTQSVWSASTDPYASVQKNNAKNKDPTRAMRYWFQEQSRKTPTETKRSASFSSHRSEGSCQSWRYWVPPTTPDLEKQRHNLRQVGGNQLSIFAPPAMEEYNAKFRERASSSRSNQRHLRSTERSSKSKRRSSRAKHSSLNLGDCSKQPRRDGRVKANQFNSSAMVQDPGMLNPNNRSDYASWWFLNAMRTNSDPTRRFTKGCQDGTRVHFGSERGADCRL